MFRTLLVIRHLSSAFCVFFVSRWELKWPRSFAHKNKKRKFHWNSTLRERRFLKKIQMLLQAISIFLLGDFIEFLSVNFVSVCRSGTEQYIRHTKKNVLRSYQDGHYPYILLLFFHCVIHQIIELPDRSWTVALHNYLTKSISLFGTNKYLSSFCLFFCENCICARVCICLSSIDTTRHLISFYICSSFISNWTENEHEVYYNLLLTNTRTKSNKTILSSGVIVH